MYNPNKARPDKRVPGLCNGSHRLPHRRARQPCPA